MCVDLISEEEEEGVGLLAAKQVIKKRGFIVRWCKREDELRAAMAGKTEEVKLWPLLVWREIPKKRLKSGNELGQPTVMQGGCATLNMASGSLFPGAGDRGYSVITNMRLARKRGGFLSVGVSLDDRYGATVPHPTPAIQKWSGGRCCS